jgi:predicted metal-dependent phosphoesterase TrpH
MGNYFCVDSMQCGGIDLHIHSTASDGTFSPSEILQLALQSGLKAIAITDHDTLDGSRQALECGIPADLHFITGVEISTQPAMGWESSGSLHILGYGIDPHHGELGQTLNKFQQVRIERIHRILDRLRHLGIALTVEQVAAEVGEGAAGRPHVATAMVKAGAVTDIDEAFHKYLRKGCPAYVGKERLDCLQAFELIRAAGGIPVLAHPALVPCRSNDELVELVASLCKIGLKGLEVYYTEHSPQDVAFYKALAEKFGLAVTGGSDFHGQLNPHVQMGKGTGGLHVPYALFETLISNYGLTYF